MRRVSHLICFAAIAWPILARPALAGEYAVLSTGFRLHADRHEMAGARVRLFSAEGVAELPADLVVNFETEEVTPRPAEAPALTTQQPVMEPAPVLIARTAPTPLSLAGEAAQKFALPEPFLRSVMQVESAFRPDAVSPKGAIGLMQLMPDTARTLRVDPLDPRQNAEGGAAYLRDLLARYEDDPNQVLLALAAYNAGPAAVERYHGVPPYPETRQYILRVLRTWRENQAHENEAGRADPPSQPAGSAPSGAK